MFSKVSQRAVTTTMMMVSPLPMKTASIYWIMCVLNHFRKLKEHNLQKLYINLTLSPTRTAKILKRIDGKKKKKKRIDDTRSSLSLL